MHLSGKRYIPVLLLILLGVLFIFTFPSKTFFLDDYHVIKDNPSIQDLSYVSRYLSDSFNRSLFYVSLIIDYNVWGLEPGGYFITNGLIHLCNAILIYFLSLFIFGRISFSLKKRRYAFLCALLFFFHPIQLLLIRQITNRAILLSAFFYLLAIHLYLHIRTRPHAALYRMFLFAGMLVLYICTIASKQIGISLPVILVLIELLLFANKKRRLPAHTFTVAAFLCTAICAHILIHTSQIFQAVNISVYQNVLTQSIVVLRYPVVFFYPFDVVPQYIQPLKTAFDMATGFSFLVILFCFVCACIASGKYRLFSLAVFWYFIVLAPSSSFIPRGNPMLIYRMYLPLYGLIVLLFATLDVFLKLKSSFFIKRGGIVILCVYYLFVIGCSFAYVPITQDELTLWLHIARVYPENNIAHYNIGSIYLRKHEYEAAYRFFKRSEELDPEYVKNIYNLGTLHYLKNEYDLAKGYFLKAVDADPHQHKYYVNLGNVYLKKKEYGEAYKWYLKYIEKVPNAAPVFNNIFYCFFDQGRYEQALFYVDKAISIEKDPRYFVNRVRANIAQGNYEKAFSDIQFLIDSYGVEEEYLFLRARYHHERGDFKSALIDYETIVASNPGHVGALNNSAILYFQSGNDQKAMLYWTTILQYDPEHIPARENIELIRTKAIERSISR
jgi:protein O-mannosyl-transferase